MCTITLLNSPRVLYLMHLKITITKAGPTIIIALLTRFEFLSKPKELFNEKSKTVEYYKKYSMTIVPSFYHWGYYFADKISKYTDPLVEKAEQHLATSLPYITQILDIQRASWKAFSQLVNKLEFIERIFW